MTRFYTLLLALCLTGFAAQAQQSVTVTTGANYADDVFYSLSDGEAGSADRANWDLAFSISPSSGILANTGAGTSVWLVSESVSDFDNVDTTGQLTDDNALYDDPANWFSGALNQPADPSDFSDIGWGIYDISTHVVTGNRVYVLADAAGNYYKAYVIDRASGVYDFRYAALDGSSDDTLSITVANYSGKNFVYLDLQSGTLLDREPADSWDLLFTKYTKMISAGPGMIVPYGVSGVKSNANVEIAEVQGVEASSFEDTVGAGFSTDADIIGSDWKEYDFASSSYLIQDSLVYFVRATDGSAWKLVFTDFTGSSAGEYTFNQKQLGTSSRADALANNQLSLYPNPATNRVTIALDDLNASSADLRIMDATGRTLQHNTLRNTGSFSAYDIDVSHLQAGVYFVTVQADHQRYTQRLVVK